MRFVGSLLSVLLATSVAFADAPAPEPAVEAPAPSPAPKKAKSSLRVVRVMTESNQALLFDKATKKHVLVEVDTLVNGYTVDAIDEDAVTLVAQGSELVLSTPERPRRGRDARTEAEDVAPTAQSLAPVDPYADPAVEPLRAVAAPKPIIAGDDGVRVALASPADTDADDVSAPAPAIIEAPAALALAPKPVITPTVLSKSELNAALADFTKLASMVRGSFTEQGVQISGVAENSVFAKAGLRAGDIVVAVDQTKLLTLDDAAELYARASSTKAANIQVLRAGKPMTLRVLFH